MDVDLYNLKNEKVGTLAVPEKVFHAKWNAALVKQVLLAQLANSRRPWAHAKGRSEVRGGGRKPWRQKGTGRARHGSIRSPLWRGGGKAHGPSKERDYSQKVNKKMKRAALYSIISKRLKDHEVKFFDSLDIEAPKTKVLAGSLKPFANADKKKTAMSILLIPNAGNTILPRAGANLPRVKVVSPNSLNPHDLLKYQQIFIDQRAVSVFEEKVAK